MSSLQTLSSLKSVDCILCLSNYFPTSFPKLEDYKLHLMKHHKIVNLQYVDKLTTEEVVRKNSELADLVFTMKSDFKKEEVSTKQESDVDLLSPSSLVYNHEVITIDDFQEGLVPIKKEVLNPILSESSSDISAYDFPVVYPDPIRVDGFSQALSELVFPLKYSNLDSMKSVLPILEKTHSSPKENSVSTYSYGKEMSPLSIDVDVRVQWDKPVSFLPPITSSPPSPSSSSQVNCDHDFNSSLKVNDVIIANDFVDNKKRKRNVSFLEGVSSSDVVPAGVTHKSVETNDPILPEVLKDVGVKWYIKKYDGINRSSEQVKMLTSRFLGEQLNVHDQRLKMKKPKKCMKVPGCPKTKTPLKEVGVGKFICQASDETQILQTREKDLGLNRVTGLKTFHCLVCHIDFNAQGAWDKHLSSRHPIVFYKKFIVPAKESMEQDYQVPFLYCDYRPHNSLTSCDKLFRTTEYYNSHVRRCHKKIV